MILIEFLVLNPNFKVTIQNLSLVRNLGSISAPKNVAPHDRRVSKARFI